MMVFHSNNSSHKFRICFIFLSTVSAFPFSARKVQHFKTPLNKSILTPSRRDTASISPRISNRSENVGRKNIILMSADSTKAITAFPLAGAVAGRIPWKRLIPTRTIRQNIGSSLKIMVQFQDLLLLSILGWVSVPMARFVFNKWTKPLLHRKIEFEDGMLFQVADHASQASKLGLAIYVMDCFVLVLNMMGLEIGRHFEFSKSIAKIVYTTWFALRLRLFKRYLLSRAASSSPQNLGKTSVYDRILDGVIFFILGLFIMDTLSLNMGRGMSSVFALGGTGTLVFSLASKDLATQFTSGLALYTSEKYFEGDRIALGDGTNGVVTRMGWMFTIIRGSDETITSVPNSHISNQKISNMSRLTKSQVTQTLWFSYSDIKKIPNLLSDIKDEIKSSCPRLITDGSRPFRAHWSDYKEDHVEVVVDCHFNIPPKGAMYWDTRQEVLAAIYRAVEKNNMEFQIPVKISKNVNVEHNVDTKNHISSLLGSED